MSFALLYTDEIRLRALEPSDVDVLMRLEMMKNCGKMVL